MIDVELSPFERFWSLGYERLIPIVPPTADIHPNSTLYKRVGTHQDGRGKTPGVKGHDGKWRSFDWAQYRADHDDLARWQAMGAGVGIKTGEGIIAIDADTMSPGHARTVRDKIEQHLGRLPIRVGRYPKALYLCRVSEPLRYTRIDFGPNTPPERVEILTEGRQFVAQGVHPVTGQPYSWPREIVPINELPTFHPDQILGLLEALRRELPAASKIKQEGSSEHTDQQQLQGDPRLVEKAVRALPNTSEAFPTREAYRDVGYAIKAALPNDEPLAYELFQDWCARWADGHNDPDVVAADWRRMKPPYRRGASWLYEIAEQHAPQHFSAAEAWFAPIDPTDIDNPTSDTQQPDDLYPVLDIDGIIDRPPPEWLVERHIPKRSVGFLVSRPGAGKSFLTLDLSLHIAFGRENWHGDAITADAETSVLYLAAEGSYGFRNRIKAWLKQHDVANRSKRFKLIEQTVNFMKPDDIGKLVKTVRRSIGLKPCLIVVDTISQSLPGADENLQKDMSLFVHACNVLRDAFACSVMGVHHESKDGGMRGSTVLLGAADFVFHLERKEKASVGVLRCEKMKEGPDRWEDAYQFDTVQIGDGQSSLVVARTSGPAGATVSVTPTTSALVLDAIDAAWESGLPWAKAPQAGPRRAVRKMVTDFGFKATEAEEVLSMWEKLGVIAVEERSAGKHMFGYRVKIRGGDFLSGLYKMSEKAGSDVFG